MHQSHWILLVFCSCACVSDMECRSVGNASIDDPRSIGLCPTSMTASDELPERIELSWFTGKCGVSLDNAADSIALVMIQ